MQNNTISSARSSTIEGETKKLNEQRRPQPSKSSAQAHFLQILGNSRHDAYSVTAYKHAEGYVALEAIASGRDPPVYDAHTESSKTLKVVISD